jgi:exosome complex component MTR3
LALLLLQAICPAIRRELFPNSFLDIYITVLENDGSILSTSITAASVALIQSGIEMLDSVVACSTVLSDRVFVMDPDRTELGPTVTMAMMPNLNQITQIYLIGKAERMIVGEVMAICTDACRAIYDGMVKPALDNFIN